MKLYVKNKVVSINGASEVFDEQGNVVLKVKGKFFTATNKKFVCDLEGNKLYTVRNKFWKFLLHSCYIIDSKSKTKLLRIKQKFFSRSYNLPINHFGLEMEGVWGEGIHIRKDGKDIGLFHTKFDFLSVFIRDAYELEVYDDNYASLLVAIVIAFDNIRDAWKNESR